MVCFRPSLTFVVSLQTQSKLTCQKQHKKLICPVPCSQGPHYFSMPRLMQGSRPACWLERAICIFYVTETCALPRGLAGRSNAQFYMAGFLTPAGEAKRGQPRGGWWLSPAGVAQAAAHAPAADVGLVGSCCLCPRDVVFCCLFRLAFCCPRAREAA